MTGFTTKRASRRLSAGAAVLVLLLVAACSGGGDQKAQGGGPVTITLQEWTAIPGTPMEKVIQAFEKQNPNITVKLAPQIPFGKEYDTRMQTQLGAGTAPTIFRMNDDYLGSFSKEGVLKDLSKYTKGRDQAQDVKSMYDFGVQADGTYTGWTVGVQPRVIFYNKDMFTKAGVDLPPTKYTDKGWKWEDFLAAAKALTVPGKQWGAAVYSDPGYEQTWSINNGSKTGIFSDDGTKFTLAEPKAAGGLQWVVDMTCKDKVQPPWSELQQDNADRDLFVAGRIAMLQTAFSDNAQLQKVVKNFEYDIAPVPGNVEQVNEGSLYLYVIPESTPQAEADAAWKLLEYIGSEEAGTILAKGGFFVPLNRKGAEAIQPKAGVPPQNMALLATAAEHSVSPNFPPQNASLARQLYRPQLDAAYNCEKSVEDVLSSVQDQVDTALAQG